MFLVLEHPQDMSIALVGVKATLSLWAATCKTFVGESGYSLFFSSKIFSCLPDFPENFPAKIFLRKFTYRIFKKFQNTVLGKFPQNILCFFRWPFFRKCCKIRDRFTFFLGNFFQNRKISYASSQISKFSCQMSKIGNFPARFPVIPSHKKKLYLSLGPPQKSQKG